MYECEWVGECESMTVWMYGCMGEWVNVWVYECVGECVYGCMGV